MLNQRVWTARELMNMSGRWPTAIATIAMLSLLGLPSPAWAQPAGTSPPAQSDPNKPRDPMKGGGKSDAKVTVSEHMTVDLHVKDEDLANVLELLSIQTQKNIIASKNVSGKVTATLYGVTFYQALDSILHVNGFGYVENGNFIYVYTNDELKQIEASLKKRVSKVVKLNYLNAKDAKEFVSGLLSKDGGEIKVNTETAAFAINDKTPTGKDDYALSATLVVIDFEENIKAIEELVKQIDTRPAQVLVEATILQTALNEANAFGVDFSVLGDLNFGDFINIGGPLGAANGLIKGGTGASGQGFSPPGDRGNAITSNPGNTAGPGTFKLGVLAGDVAIFLKLLDQVTDSITLANPKILALNRQPSRVLVGKRVGYLNTTSTETSTTQTVNFLDTGTQLYFRPFVSSEGEVRMELKPQVSAAEIRNVTDANGQSVTIPDEVTQEITTNVIIKDGQTVVLGGLFTESSTFTRRQVPWFGDIPILGAAFKGHDDATARSEIIFLVTPTIINDGQMAAAADRYAGGIEQLRTGARQKLLPWSQDRMTDALNVEAEKLAREGNSEQALWNIQRSLSYNANQPEAYRLRERISGEKERWNNRSFLNEIIGSELHNRIESITPNPNLGHSNPWGSRNTVREPVSQNFNTGAGSNKKIIGNSSSQDSTPVVAVSEQHSSASDSASYITDYTTPSSNNTDNTYRAAMTPSDSTSTELTNSSTGQFMVSTTSTSEPSTNVTVTSQPMQTVGSSNAGVGSLDSALRPLVKAPSHSTPSTVATPVVNSSTNSVNTSNEHAVAVETSSTSEHAAPSSTESTPVAQAAVSTDTQTVSVDNALVLKTQSTLNNLRGQIELFSLMNDGAFPQLGADTSNGWKPLFDAKLIEKMPANTYIGGANASKIKVADAADAKFTSDYGWVFDPKSGKLWAAGFDANDKPFNKSASSNDMVNAINPSPKTPNPAANQGHEASNSTAGVEEPKN